MRQIIWSEDAETDYEQNLDYLLERWSVKEAEEFVDKVDRALNTLRTERAKYKPTKYRGVFECVIVKHISLYYREKNGYIELVRFWNNSQDDKKLKL